MMQGRTCARKLKRGELRPSQNRKKTGRVFDDKLRPANATPLTRCGTGTCATVISTMMLAYRAASAISEMEKISGAFLFGRHCSI